MDSQLEPTYLHHMTINIKRAVVKGIRIYQKLPQIKVYYFINVLVYTLLTLKNTNFFLFSLFKKFSSFSISLITFFFGIFQLSCHGFLQIYFKELQFLDFHSRLLRDTFLKKTQFERISRYHCYDKTQGMTTVISVLYWVRLNHDVNGILNYRTNYQLRKCRKQDCSSTGVLIVTFHEM